MGLADAGSALQRAGAPSRFIDAAAFLALATALAEVRTVADLLFVTRHRLQAILPHGAFALVAAPAGSCDGAVRAVFGCSVPEDYLAALREQDGWRRSPAALSWLANDEPGFFQLEDHGHGADAEWLERFSRSGLRNMMACGVRHILPGQTISFNFFRLPGPPHLHQRQALKLALPHFHYAVLRILPEISQQGTGLAPLPGGGGAAGTLTPREREVLEWVRRGKTNAEIAAIRGVAYKTVKNQVQAILVKLRVNNRAQAVASAIERGLI
ncbi:LuxR C-terminal-related transcriptional regulator [Thiobacter aerophilum]|uniref:LuxR C-terminal-related transcriptional regulator n=1 Tax=Thiobacter aerophilum TaxID=3121275 RepID=A0ABV0EGQ8_9BURK